MINKFANVQTTTTPSAVYQPKRLIGNNSNTGTFGVAITGSASVNLEGAFEPNGPWFVINTFTSTGAQGVNLFPHMRVNPTANSGSFSAWIYE